MNSRVMTIVVIYAVFATIMSFLAVIAWLMMYLFSITFVQSYTLLIASVCLFATVKRQILDNEYEYTREIDHDDCF